MPYGNTTASTSNSNTNVSSGGSANAGSSGNAGQVGAGPSLTVNTGFGLGDTASTGLGDGSGLDATGGVQDLYDQQQEEEEQERTGQQFNQGNTSDTTEDLYENQMISDEVNFSSLSQMSVLIKQDKNMSGVLSILEDDTQIQSTGADTQQFNQQSITPSQNTRYN